MGTETGTHFPSVWHQIPDITPENYFTFSFCVLVECYIDITSFALITFCEPGVCFWTKMFFCCFFFFFAIKASSYNHIIFIMHHFICRDITSKGHHVKETQFSAIYSFYSGCVIITEISISMFRWNKLTTNKKSIHLFFCNSFTMEVSVIGE